MNIDDLYHRKYDENNYNCAHFAAEVWMRLKQQDISEALGSFLTPKTDRSAPYPIRRMFGSLDGPVSPCIVLIRGHKRPPHVGVYWGRKVLHLDRLGVKYAPLSTFRYGFSTARFYDVPSQACGSD